MRPTYAEIDLGAIHYNLKQIRKKVGRRPLIMAVVKANAYGHGMIQVARSILKDGTAGYFGVAIVEEGIQLRENGIAAPVLVLTAAPEPQLELFVKHGLEATVCSMAVARKLDHVAARTGGEGIIHVKVDTGMGRIGIPPVDAVAFVEELRKLKHLKVAGVFTHFATSDDRDHTFAKRQLSTFKSLLAALHAAGFDIPLKHCANSGAILQHPDSYFDLVRPGIMIYGHPPSRTVSPMLPLRPAMSLRSRIEFMKTVEKGTSISYGRRYFTRGRTTIGSVAIGYGDGFSRRLTNKASVLVNGKRFPVVGTICMDQVMIDVGIRSSCKVGDRVTLMGKDGKEEISIWQISDQLGTIPYEVCCSITERVPRNYIHGRS
ncbi:MAG TPA: alanine racemase [Bacteroidota bacterium]|nr:alanine racemase [Bacteroidota bacterium]